MSGPWPLATTISVIEDSLATGQATLRAEAERCESMEVDDVADRLEVIAGWLPDIHDHTRIEEGRGIEIVADSSYALAAYDDDSRRVVNVSF